MHVGVIVEEIAVVCAVVIVLRSTPKKGVVAEMVVVAAVVVASGKGRKACGIVRACIITHRTCFGGTAPSRGGGQCLANITTATAALVLRLAAHIVGQLCPLRIARHMPACGTDSLHTTWIGTTGGRISHHSLPIIQIPVCAHIGTAIVRIITIGGACTCTAAQRYACAIAIMCGAQVLLHPALVTNFHRIVGIVVIVGHYGGSRAWLAIGNGSSKTPLWPIARTRTVGGVSPHIVGSAWGQTCNVAGEAARATAIGGVAIANRGILRGAPAYTTNRYRRPAIRGYIASASSRGRSNVTDRISRQCRCYSQSCKTPLFSITCFHTVGGIRPHIVGGARGQTCHIAGETTHTTAIGGVAVADRGVLRSTPAYTTSRYRRTTSRSYITTAGS